MRFFILSVFIFLFVSHNYAQTKASPFTFDKTTIDYGTIKKGSDPLRKFTFTNTSKEKAIISSATGSCGCTVPTYPKEPISPGEKSTIEVRYDTSRLGQFSKTVTVVTYDGSNTVLTITGNVVD
jgi:hypothetical protein